MSDADSKPESKAPEPKPVPGPAVAKPAAEPRGLEPAKAAPTPGRAPASGRNRVLFGLSILGLVGALVAAYLFGIQRKPQPPAFAPISSPYASAIYADGIIESDQPNGSNINVYPEVSGPITGVSVHEGQQVSAGTVLLTIDDSVQRAATAQLRLQAEAAVALLDELKAQPRLETLAIAGAQVALAAAALRTAGDQRDKDRAAFAIDPKSISRDVLDTAEDAAAQAGAALEVARRQYDLTRAGAWSYDVAAQERQCEALSQAFRAADALLQKYSIRAPVDGVVLSLYAAVGSTVSPQGAYDPHTSGFDPVAIMGSPQEHLQVRCFVDEILISRLPSPWHIRAEMSVTGSSVKVPLEFVRVQPYVSPKIELSDERQEKVDLRVLPVIFRFQKRDAPVYPGQLVDVYIGQD